MYEVMRVNRRRHHRFPEGREKRRFEGVESREFKSRERRAFQGHDQRVLENRRSGDCRVLRAVVVQLNLISLNGLPEGRRVNGEMAAWAEARPFTSLQRHPRKAVMVFSALC